MWENPSKRSRGCSDKSSRYRSSSRSSGLIAHLPTARLQVLRRCGHRRHPSNHRRTARRGVTTLKATLGQFNAARGRVHAGWFPASRKRHGGDLSSLPRVRRQPTIHVLVPTLGVWCRKGSRYVSRADTIRAAPDAPGGRLAVQPVQLTRLTSQTANDGRTSAARALPHGPAPSR